MVTDGYKYKDLEGFVVLQWFVFYLANNYQAIKVKSTLSDLCKLLYGEPQDSVLGVILLSMYTTPLIRVIDRHSNITFHIYTNETQPYVHIANKIADVAFQKNEWMSALCSELNVKYQAQAES